MQKSGEFGNKIVFLQTNNINLVKNVAGVSASDDDLRYFEESAGTLPHDKAVTLFYGSIMVHGSEKRKGNFPKIPFCSLFEDINI